MGKNLLIILLLLIFIQGQSFAIDEEYKNNLSDLSVKSQNNTLNLTIYTDKPYQEPLKVLPKQDNQYVLLLPETSSTADKEKVLKSLKESSNGLITNVELSQHDFPEKKNGYTKLTISTSEPLEITTDAKMYLEPPKVHIDRSILTKKTTPQEKPTAKAKVVAKKQSTTNKNIVAPKKVVKKNTQLAKPVVKKQEPLKKVEEPKVSTNLQAPVAPKVPSEKISSERKLSSETVSPEKTTPVIPTTEDINNAPLIKYDNVIDNDIKEHIPFANKNLLLPFLFLLLSFFVFKNKAKLMQFYKKFVYQEKELPQSFSDVYKPKKKKKNKPILNPTPKQETLRSIMDNTSLSWQERYNLLKQHELNALEDDLLRKRLTPNDIAIIKNSSTKDIYKQNQDKFQQSKEGLDILYDLDTTDIKEKVAFYDNQINNAKGTIKQSQTTQTQVATATTQAVKEDVPYLNFDKNAKIDEKSRKKELFPKVQGNIGNIIEKTKTPVPTVKPIMLQQLALNSVKGFYLAKYENELALIGYINNDIYLLSKLKELSSTKMQARLNEKQKDKDLYIVKVDNYKFLIEVTAYQMKLVLEL